MYDYHFYTKIKIDKVEKDRLDICSYCKFPLPVLSRSKIHHTSCRSNQAIKISFGIKKEELKDIFVVNDIFGNI